MKKPDSLSHETILNGFLTVKKECLRFPSGFEHDHFTLSLPAPTSVSIIPIDDKGLLIINEEYRHSAGNVVLSLPGGFLHENEEPIPGAKRELIEETGYDSENLVVLGSSFPMPGICGQKVIYVLAKDCQKVTDPNLEGGEIIRTIQMPLDELSQKVTSGNPVDGILLGGLWLMQLNQK